LNGHPNNDIQTTPVHQSLHRSEMMNRVIVAGLVASSVSAQYTPAAEADRVVDLPDAPEVDYNMFAGYLQVDAENDVNYFYWFAECDGCDAATAPVALWTNGNFIFLKF
jgi:hypothetical protein